MDSYTQGPAGASQLMASPAVKSVNIGCVCVCVYVNSQDPLLQILTDKNRLNSESTSYTNMGTRI
jgi:hypothetical protein